MSEKQVHSCVTCPAFSHLAGEGATGTCRAHAPRVFPEREFFRGSSREMLFGSYPAVGSFPLVTENDFCMEHPANRRDFWA